MTVAEAEGFVAMVCFKHGPPQLYGVELDWTVHHAEDPHRPLDADRLRKALGAHAPATLVSTSEKTHLFANGTITPTAWGRPEASRDAAGDGT